MAGALQISPSCRRKKSRERSLLYQCRCLMEQFLNFNIQQWQWKSSLTFQHSKVGNMFPFSVSIQHFSCRNDYTHAAGWVSLSIPEQQRILVHLHTIITTIIKWPPYGVQLRICTRSILQVCRPKAWIGTVILFCQHAADLILDKVSESLVLNRSEPCTRAGLRNGHTNTTS